MTAPLVPNPRRDRAQVLVRLWMADTVSFREAHAANRPVFDELEREGRAVKSPRGFSLNTDTSPEVRAAVKAVITALAARPLGSPIPLADLPDTPAVAEAVALLKSDDVLKIENGAIERRHAIPADVVPPTPAPATATRTQPPAPAPAPTATRPTAPVSKPAAAPVVVDREIVEVLKQSDRRLGELVAFFKGSANTNALEGAREDRRVEVVLRVICEVIAAYGDRSRTDLNQRHLRWDADPTRNQKTRLDPAIELGLKSGALVTHGRFDIKSGKRTELYRLGTDLSVLGCTIEDIRAGAERRKRKSRRTA